MGEYGRNINIFIGTHDFQAKIDHITSHHSETLFQPWEDCSSFANGRDLNESRCNQPEKDVGKSVNWLKSYSLGNGNRYEEPTVSSIYMGWMADWLWVEEWDLAGKKETPLSSTAIHFHYNTPLKPAAHNHGWNLIRGGKLLLFTSSIIQNCAQCIHRHKSLTIWFMLM